MLVAIGGQDRTTEREELMGEAVRREARSLGADRALERTAFLFDAVLRANVSWRGQ